jgi:hypothetical protein
LSCFLLSIPENILYSFFFCSFQGASFTGLFQAQSPQ